MPKLSKTELMALDLMIQSMKDEQLGIEVNPAAFIGGIIRVVEKVANFVQKITPILKVVTKLTPVVAEGIAPRTSASLKNVEGKIEADISLDTLIALRDALNRDD